MSFEDDVRIYFFDVASQLSTKEIDRFVFRVSSSGYKNCSVASLVEGLPLVPVELNSLGNPRSLKKIFLKHCKYELYRGGFDFDFCEDPSLEAGGISLEDKHYIPSWFLGKREVVGSQKNFSSIGLDGFSNISIGDYLIHEDFGVGSFSGIVCDDNENDMFVSLKYGDGVVSVGLNNLSVLGYYDSGDLDIPLNNISKKGLWKKRVSRVSKQVDSFVEELLLKHMGRLSCIKERAPIDKSLLTEFLLAFKHKDTKDQSVAFEEVLLDLTSPEPMDRLLCGDVGFGKTEIAIRASFLSVLMGGKVIVLAPTTILCYQLFNSFSSRLKDFSINVLMFSRLVGEKQTKEALGAFSSGSVDVLVCTQKIFSYIKNISSLSMIIIDEEHRFGVKQKELFLDKFPSLDVLSMSATPIPRSLQQAFSGIKTISTISTPPVNRRPIQTSILFFDLEKVLQSILTEINRGGQVYFLHNNIASLQKISRLISDKLPNIRVAIVHGKMKALDVENIMKAFVVGKYDLLISTSIIESGLDIPNVNTIIINNAHLFGLSQLHQIRGRVGRHDRQAFAYLLIPRALKLNSQSKKRLKAIEENVSLGSGYNIASKDLDIRGAGSVFGYAQSGGSSVGFELYNKLLSQSFSKSGAPALDPHVDVFNSTPCFPSNYIKEEVLRLSLYKKLSDIDSGPSLESFKSEILNRFGALPLEVKNLLMAQQIKILAKNCFVSSVFKTKKGGSLVFLPGEHVLDTPSFVSFLTSFFKTKNVHFSINQQPGSKLLVSFDCLNRDICVVLIDLLNKFIGLFLKENK